MIFCDLTIQAVATC